jgi:peptidoglycan/LPS O-acetylase OafA/YrhL
MSLHALSVRRGYQDSLNAQSAYRPDIDGLRALAVSLVLVYHAFPHALSGGFTGVDIFFVISGFLISSNILHHIGHGDFSLFDFYRRRVRRIFPALILVLVTCTAIGWFVLFADENQQLGRHVAGGAGFVSNLLLWSEAGYFDNSAITKPLLHLWSLGVEEQFYILWPILLWLSFRARVPVTAVIVCVGFASFWYNLRLTQIDVVAAFYSPLPRFWELMLGAFLATAMKSKSLNRFLSAPQQSPIAEVSSALGLALIVFGATFIEAGPGFPGWRALFPCVGAALIIGAGPLALTNKYLLSLRPPVWLGLISYPVYLWHWPLFSMYRIIEGVEPNALTSVLFIVASLFLGWLTYRLVETPIRSSLNYNATFGMLLVGMVAVGSFGLYIYRNDGVPSRAIMLQAQQKKALIEGPLWTYTSNDTCLKRYPFEEAKTYTVWFCAASKDAPPNILLLGNSYANHLYPGIAQAPGLSHNSVLSIGTCEPDERLMPNPEPAADPCFGARQLHQQTLINNIIRQSGTLRAVIFDSLRGAPREPYVSALRRRIDIIESQGIQVILFVPHLTLDYDIRGCLARPFKSAARDCEISAERRAAIKQEFSKLTDQIIASNPKVLIFDQNDAFCDAQKCSLMRDGLPLFRDEAHHYSQLGSRLVGELFRDWATVNVPQLLSTSP